MNHPALNHSLQSAPTWISSVDRVLRSGPAEESPMRLRTLILCTLSLGMIYGAVMGSYSGLEPGRYQLLFFSACKVPVLILGAFALSIPSFYVLNTLLGLSHDFGNALRGLAATQAGLTIVLASLAPLTATYYASVSNYSQAVSFNGLMFLVASCSAQVLLRRHYNPLIAGNERHRWMLRGWLVIYSFVAIQLAWILRPFVGDPKSPPEFFRADVLSENAYVVVVRLALRFLTGE